MKLFIRRHLIIKKNGYRVLGIKRKKSRLLLKKNVRKKVVIAKNYTLEQLSYVVLMKDKQYFMSVSNVGILLVFIHE